MDKKSNTISEKAYGKINLYLDVLGKRDDGYHDILSVMHTVELHDTVKVAKAENVISMTCTDASLSCGEDNLCIKAAKAYFSAAGINGGCMISLEKLLPRGAGMGGGSADAAAVLRALNKLYGTRFNDKQLCDIGKNVGADVPFCVVGGCRIAQGIGEVLTEHTPLPDCTIIVCEGGEKVSTPEAYGQIDRTQPSRVGDFRGFEEAMQSGNIEEICSKLYNRFEDTCPSCSAVKNALIENGATGALMTGSGSAVFGIFDGYGKAASAQAAIEERGVNCYLTRPAVKSR